MTEVSVKGPLLAQSRVCELVLRALPEWFGMEVGIQNYIRKAEKLPSFVAYAGNEAIGLALVQRHFEHSAEIDLMGVLPAHHRHGVGRALLAAVERWCVALGVQFLQVKTVSERKSYPSYAKTRQFYLAMNFVPLEEMPTLWDESNPCLILIKRIP